MSTAYQERMRLIEELSARVNDLAPALGLLGEMVGARAEARKGIVIDRLPDEAVRARLTQGEAIIRREEIDGSSPWLVGHAAKVGQILERYGLLPKEPVDLSHPLTGPGSATALRLSSDSPADNEAMLAGYMMFQVLRPFYEACRETYLPILRENDWSSPYCPVCGSPPVLGRRVGEGGKRYLCCGVCDTCWPYLMFKCPFCGEERRDMLFSFRVDEEPFRVDGCRSCGRYLKVAEGGDQGPDDAFVELDDIRSVRLDVAAMGEGFRSDW